MATTPYPYGGGTGGTPYRNAMLNAMGNSYDPYDPQPYQPMHPQQVATQPTSRAGAFTDLAGSAATDIAGQIGQRAAANATQSGVQSIGGIANAAQGVGSGAGWGGGIANVGRMGAGTAAGVGLATELVGGLLKPKGQAATASPFADLTDQYGRRMEGSGDGIAGGAVKWGGRGAQVGNVVPGVGTLVGAGIGALGGAIGGAITKNAASAYSDFSRADAENAIREMYKTRGGRDITPEELNRIMVGAGTKPGDKFVGEKGLYSVLQSLDQNFAAERTADPTAHAAQAYAAAHGLPSPMVPPAAGAAPATDRVTTPEDLAGMNQDPQSVRTGPDGRPIPDSGPGGMTGRPSDNVYGPAGNTTLGNGIADTHGAQVGQGVLPGDVIDANTPAPAQATGDQTKWDTDNYAKPAYTAPKPSAAAPPGFDSKKWNDPNHQTPKYVVGRILSQYPPSTENMDKVVAEIAKAYPGARRSGSGDITIPGVGSADILVGADVGGKRWHFGGGGGKKDGSKGPGKVAGATAGAGGGYDAALGYAPGGDIAGASSLASIIAQIQKASGGTGKRGGIPSARDLVLQGMKG